MPMNIEELIPMGMHNIAKRMTDNLQMFAGITSMASNVVRVSRDLIGGARVLLLQIIFFVKSAIDILRKLYRELKTFLKERDAPFWIGSL